jgi:uncharacterized surface protein with fasciclin (FAS1) repeats
VPGGAPAGCVHLGDIIEGEFIYLNKYMKKIVNSMKKWPVGVLVLCVVLLLAIWLGAGGTLPTSLSTIIPAAEEQNTTTTQSSKTVAGIIAGIEYGGRFSQLLSSTGVGASLTGKGPYTVFVATDGAFGRLVPGTINSLSAAEQKRLMQYHVVVGKKLDVDATFSGQIQALSKDTINFQVDASQNVYVNSGKVLETYRASNGIVYVINSVLVPPKPLQ